MLTIHCHTYKQPFANACTSPVYKPVALQGDDLITAFQQLKDLSDPFAKRQWLATHRPLFALTFQSEESLPGVVDSVQVWFCKKCHNLGRH